MNTQIVNVPISNIQSNPFRNLDSYPFVEHKLSTLQRSISDMGLWEGVIAREYKGNYQIAFGHHRVEAAKRSGIGSISLIVKNLSDKEMMQMMGRENLEDYNADFLCMLETYEAAEKFLEKSMSNDGLCSAEHKSIQPIEIAKLLGWTRFSPHEILSNTASACNAASKLIKGGYNTREEFKDLSIKAVREITQRAIARMEQLEKAGKIGMRPHSEVQAAKKQVGKAVKAVARETREGSIAQRDIRAEVDVKAYRFAREAKKQLPIFSVFGEALADSIAKILKGDKNAEKLNEVILALGDISVLQDVETLKRIQFELNNLGVRCDDWEKKLILPRTKIVELKQLNREE